jgi:hypothetical protein
MFLMTYSSRMDIEKLAVVAKEFLNGDVSWSYRKMHGIEFAPGFFNMVNESTGQSKIVLYHEETGFVFKRSYGCERWTLSGSYIGTVNFDGIDYRVRLPEFYNFGDVVAQEYIGGPMHDCNGQWSCEHTRALSLATGYNDCHAGNWKIHNGEVVLFDFD